jgi:uncharacterized protein YjeT (DUF2065 family)
MDDSEVGSTVLSSRAMAQWMGQPEREDRFMTQQNVLRIVGFVLVLIGVVWALQGGGILPGSVMSGQRQWLIIGIGLIAAGAALLIRAFRR